MIIKSNSQGNLAEDKSRNKFTHRNNKDENNLKNSSKYGTTLRKRKGNRQEITYLEKQVQFIPQNIRARGSQQSRRQKVYPHKKQKLPKPSVITEIVDITNLNGKTMDMQNSWQSLRKHTNGHTSVGSSTAPNDYKLLLNILRGRMLER